MNRRRRALITVAVLFACAVTGLNLLAYRHAYRMMHFASSGVRTGEPETLAVGQKVGTLFCGTRIPRPVSTASPAELGPTCQRIAIGVTNQITLGSWYCPGPPKSPLVILFHGYASEKTSLLPEAKALLAMGASVLLVDFRGSGESSESYTTVGYDEAQDVAAAMRFAQGHFTPPQVILYGQSMGAAAVLRAVHSCGVRPDAIIVEAVFDKMLTTVQHRFQAMGMPSFPSAQLLVFWGGRQAGFNGFSHNPVDYARSVTCPILFLHGTDDPRAHIEEGRHVFDAVPGRKRFQEFPGLKHEAAVNRDRETWNKAVESFLRATAKPTA